MSHGNRFDKHENSCIANWSADNGPQPKTTDWQMVKLGSQVVKIGSGTTPRGGQEVYQTCGVPFIRSQNVRTNRLMAADMAYISQEIHQRMQATKTQSGDVLLNITGASIGRACVIPSQFPEANVNQHVCIIRTKDSLSPNYLSDLLNSDIGQRLIAASQAGGNREGLNFQQIAQFQIALPPISEQLEIAEILTCWDKAIELVERLIEEKRAAFASLRQSVISGFARFPQFKSSPLKASSFGSFLTESRIGGSDGRTAKKLTIKLYGRGIEPKSSSREGSESTRYYKRKAGQFIYSKLDFLNGAFAIIPPELDGYESTLDLPSFDVATSVNPQWLLHYVNRPEFYRNKLDIAAGGRKARRVNPADFLALDIKLPCRKEQDCISEALASGQREIELLMEYCTRLTEQKRALMQKLLTGKIRVKV